MSAARLARFPFWRAPSLATRLVLSALCCCALILIVAGIILSAVYGRAAERAFDERLQVYLAGIVTEMAASSPMSLRDRGALADPRFDWPLSGWYWQIAPTDGTVGDLRTSRSLYGAQLTVPPAHVPAPDRTLTGYLSGPDDRRHRYVSRRIDFGDDGAYDITVAGPVDAIEAEKREFTLYLVLTFTLLGLALAATTLLQVRFGLAPLARLRRAIGSVRQGEAERISGDYPADVAPLAAELNLLIEVNRKFLDRARTQVGNLAHALKTPLSVIVNEADRTLQQPAAGELPRLVRDQADVMRSQISYYLDLARAAALAATLGASAEVSPVALGLVRTLGRIYAGRGIVAEVEVEEGLRFHGDAQDLQDLVGNLAENAFKWSRSRVHVQAVAVKAATTGAGASMISITVDDDGPGMEPAARETALARGKRLDETVPGSGLGLAIAAELAQLYGGSLRLQRSPPGGLRAVATLPGAVAPAGVAAPLARGEPDGRDRG